MKGPYKKVGFGRLQGFVVLVLGCWHLGAIGLWVLQEAVCKQHQSQSASSGAGVDSWQLVLDILLALVSW